MKNAEVGVSPRARALVAASPKKRKADANQDFEVSRSKNFKLRSGSRRRVLITSENSVSPPSLEAHNSGEWSVVEDRCSRDHASATCCPSDGNCDGAKFADPKDEGSVKVETSKYYSNGESRRETTPLCEVREELSAMLDSNPLQPESKSYRKSMAEKKMPTEHELEEFFVAAEKKLLKQLSDKYNFDFEKDKPLEGRYEWVQSKL